MHQAKRGLGAATDCTGSIHEAGRFSGVHNPLPLVFTRQTAQFFAKHDRHNTRGEIPGLDGVAHFIAGCDGLTQQQIVQRNATLSARKNEERTLDFLSPGRIGT